MVDVEYSAFFDGFCNHDLNVTCSRASRIEEVGRSRVEPSFLPGAIIWSRYRMQHRWRPLLFLSRRPGRKVGGSTGTNFIGLCWLAARMRAGNEAGSLATLICDSGDRYITTYYDADWVQASGLDIEPWTFALETFLDGGPLQINLAEAS